MKETHLYCGVLKPEFGITPLKVETCWVIKCSINGWMGKEEAKGVG